MTAISESDRSAEVAAPPTPTPPTSHRRLLSWVAEVAELTEPKAIYWCDGSEAEWAQLTDTLVDTGTLIRLNPDAKPNSFLARSDPDDVARVIVDCIAGRRDRDNGKTIFLVRNGNQLRETIA